MSMKEIFRTNDPTKIAFASAILEGEGVKAFVMDAHMSVLEGQIGILPRRVMVADRDYTEARSILASCDLDIPEER